MFVPDKNLKDLIISYLKKDEISISALTRNLHKDGYKFHRLYLTGYLKALTDQGVLKERNLPPSKVYTASAYRGQNIYETVGSQCRLLIQDERRQVRMAISILQRLFRRPIFLREIKECGFGTQIDAMQASKEEKEETRKGLLKIGIQVPTNEPAYYIKERKDPLRDNILQNIIINKFEIGALIQSTRQVKLEEKRRS